MVESGCWRESWQRTRSIKGLGELGTQVYLAADKSQEGAQVAGDDGLPIRVVLVSRDQNLS